LSRLNLSLLLFTIISICGCSEIRPFEDRYREPGTEYIYRGASKPGSPTLCYNPLFYDKNDVDIMADKLCKSHNKASKAEFKEKEAFSCRLFIPTKMHYRCVVDK
jgi:hypothetical protein